MIAQKKSFDTITDILTLIIVYCISYYDSNCLSNKVPIETVSSTIGHRSIKTTRKVQKL
jgi:hypothetical protein